VYNASIASTRRRVHERWRLRDSSKRTTRRAALPLKLKWEAGFLRTQTHLGLWAVMVIAAGALLALAGVFAWPLIIR
jgi:hypothetical protein